jgi:hypothetical protein
MVYVCTRGGLQEGDSKINWLVGIWSFSLEHDLRRQKYEGKCRVREKAGENVG